MDPMINIGVKAARAASKVMLHNVERLDQLKIEKKGRADFVSEVDRQAEEIIIETIQGAYPDHAILAEESGTRGNSDHVWIIDPLDGTTNYLQGIPHYAISLAVMRGKQIYDAKNNYLVVPKLYGEDAQLDSMGLVSFLIDIEESFLDQDIELSLTIEIRELLPIEADIHP